MRTSHPDCRSTCAAKFDLLWNHSDTKIDGQLCASVYRQLEHVGPAIVADRVKVGAVIAVAWDTQLSPVDVRLLTAAQRAQDDQGSVFFLDRAKTGRAAAGTLSRWSEAILEAYLKTLPAAPIGDALLFRNRSGAPYSKDTLGDDFREIREMVLGPEDDRQLADLRRSGTVEAFAGKADPASVSSKMANTLSASNRLHKTYNPVNVVVVREVDAARTVGRKRLRTKNKTG